MFKNKIHRELKLSLLFRLGVKNIHLEKFPNLTSNNTFFRLQYFILTIFHSYSLQIIIVYKMRRNKKWITLNNHEAVSNNILISWRNKREKEKKIKDNEHESSEKWNQNGSLIIILESFILFLLLFVEMKVKQKKTKR